MVTVYPPPPGTESDLPDDMKRPHFPWHDFVKVRTIVNRLDWPMLRVDAINHLNTVRTFRCPPERPAEPGTPDTASAPFATDSEVDLACNIPLPESPQTPDAPLSDGPGETEEGSPDVQEKGRDERDAGSSHGSAADVDEPPVDPEQQRNVVAQDQESQGQEQNAIQRLDDAAEIEQDHGDVRPSDGVEARDDVQRHIDVPADCERVSGANLGTGRDESGATPEQHEQEQSGSSQPADDTATPGSLPQDDAGLETTNGPLPDTQASELVPASPAPPPASPLPASPQWHASTYVQPPPACLVCLKPCYLDECWFCCRCNGASSTLTLCLQSSPPCSCLSQTFYVVIATRRCSSSAGTARGRSRSPNGTTGTPVSVHMCSNDKPSRY